MNRTIDSVLRLAMWPCVGLAIGSMLMMTVLQHGNIGVVGILAAALAGFQFGRGTDE